MLEKVVANSRTPADPNYSSGIDLGIVNLAHGQNKRILTPENRVEQIHWRHLQCLIHYRWIWHLHRYHLFLSIFDSKMCQRRIKIYERLVLTVESFHFASMP